MQETEGRLARDPDAEESLAARELAAGPSTLRIPILAEQVVVEKTSVSDGSVRLHKGVATEEQTLRVPVFHEEATIEHLPPEALGEGATSDDPDVLIIPIYEEQVVVEKRIVLKEYIRVSKRRVVGEDVIRETVRREFMEVDGPATEIAATSEDARSMSATDG